MEKIIYPVWKSDLESDADFKARLLGDVSEKLLADKRLRKLQINIVDDAVAPAAPTRQINTLPPVNGMIVMWVDTAVYRKPLEEIIQASVARMAGYLVTESEPIPNDMHVMPDGERTPGYAQIVFLQRPPRLTYGQWLEIWQGSHTAVGVETQSNFRYVQNVIVRPLTYAAPAFDAIIEEGFPVEAMTDPRAFYDAVGDEEKYQANFRRMMDSCSRFIDFDKMDCIPTSEYIIKS